MCQRYEGKPTGGARTQRIGMGFEPPELNRLAHSLRLKMADHDVDLADLATSGLGYANLLFLATVVLELQLAHQSELMLFLIEEPEAHLHAVGRTWRAGALGRGRDADRRPDVPLPRRVDLPALAGRPGQRGPGCGEQDVAADPEPQ